MEEQMSEDFKVFFIEEAAELFANIHTLLLEAEESGDLGSRIDPVFRDMHTLKGGSGSVGLSKFSEYTHHLENFLSAIREGTIDVSTDVISFLIDEADYLEELIHKDFSGELDLNEYKNSLSNMIKEIGKFKSGDNGASKFDESNAELLDLFDSLFDVLDHVEESEEINEDTLKKIFRYVHTLKGSSVFLGLKKFPDYLHHLEDMLDKARNGDINYSLKENSFVYDKMKISKDILYSELHNSINNENYNSMLSELKDDIKFLSEGELQSTGESEAYELFGFDDLEEEEETSKDEATSDGNYGSEELGYELFLGENAPKKEVKAETFPEKETPKKVMQKPALEPVSKKEPLPKVVKKNEKSKEVKQVATSNSIRVGLDKIDNLMNRVGDLVITKSMLYQYADSIVGTVGDTIIEKLGHLDREMRELQEAVMSVRMVPMESVYAKLPKIVRDLAKKLNKKVKFEHFGDSVEIDKLMVEGLMDPLTHIIRNSLDHGIESVESRTHKRKRSMGRLTINAEQESGNIVITIDDDGAGINTDKVSQKALESGVITEEELERMDEVEKAMLIFSPGLSTADAVSDVSGRGVGMDVVMNNINSLGGSIKIETKKDVGTKFIIILPLTLAILDGLNIIIGDKKLILPINMIVESLQPYPYMIKKVGENEDEILMLRHEFIPIIRLHKVFNLEPRTRELDAGMIIITKVANLKVALFVDDFLNQEQIVVKSLEKNYKKIPGISAATIRGDGTIGYILDVLNIVEEAKISGGWSK